MADASAALGIIGRTGLGKLRHIDMSYLWPQQDSIRKKLGFNKVKGTDNPADMNTKGLSEDEINKYVDMLNMEHRQGRADLAPEAHNIIHDIRCCRFNSTNKHKNVRSTHFYPSLGLSLFWLLWLFVLFLHARAVLCCAHFCMP